MAETTDATVGASEPHIDRRRAIKLAAGAAALGTVLGVTPRQSSASTQEKDKMVLKERYLDGKKVVGEVTLPDNVAEFLSSGHSSGMKIETVIIYDGKDNRIGERTVSPEIAAAVRKFSESMGR